jgi:hypothetical protein
MEMNDKIKDLVKHITAANARFYQATQCIADEAEIQLRIAKCVEAYDTLSESLYSGLMKEPWERGE